MTALQTIGLLSACGLIGCLGAILGVGGGIFIVPLLGLALGMPLQHAAGTALICVLGTSAAGSIALDRTRLANLRVVAFLQLTTVVGAVAGALLAGVLPEAVVGALFAAMLLYAAWRMVARARATRPAGGRPPAPPPQEVEPQRLGPGMALSTAAGVASGLLGIGGGPIQVPLMSELMRLPLPVALATSNTMVGITAAASAGIYYLAGAIDPGVTAPCALGTAVGAYVGGRIAPRLDPRPLAGGFAVLLLFIAGSMLWRTVLKGP